MIAVIVQLQLKIATNLDLVQVQEVSVTYSRHIENTLFGFKCLVILSGMLLRNDTYFTITHLVKESQRIAYTVLTTFQFVQYEPFGEKQSALFSFTLN